MSESERLSLRRAAEAVVRHWFQHYEQDPTYDNKAVQAADNLLDAMLKYGQKQGVELIRREGPIVFQAGASQAGSR